ncbi:MAG: sulfite exporter TauE/SafE family protein [Betaproteobacteria bacterium]|nr:sulfite exporter TauE/SafE family protein [Betaproteobacteria bacterium]
MSDMVILICVVTSAYFIRGMTGFGSGLIAIPLLALSFPLQFAIPLILALDFTASLVLGGLNRTQTDWGEIKALLPAGLIGGIIGIVALFKLPATPILLGMGAFVIFVGLRNVIAVQSTEPIDKRWAVPAGLAGGATGALFGVSAPPYVMYLSRRVRDKGRMRATFSCLFVVDGAARLTWFAIAGVLLEPQLLLTYLYCLVPMAFGLYSGRDVHLDMTTEGMLKAIGVLLVISGAMLFLRKR